jgi:hypothetical protein
MVLKPSSGEVFTVTISGGGIGSITGEIAVEGSDTPVPAPGGISPTKPEAPDKPLEPAEPEKPAETEDSEEPEKPGVNTPPVVKDEPVHFLLDNMTGLTIPYIGSGTVALETGEDIGQISAGKLSLAVPETVSGSRLQTLSDLLPLGEGTPVEGAIVFSDPGAKGAMFDAFEFTEQEGGFPGAPHSLFLIKDLRKSDDTLIAYLYVDKPLTIKGRCKTRGERTEGDHTLIDISDEKYDLNLQAGWNRFQYTSKLTENNKPGVYESTQTISFENAPADISAFKWVLWSWMIQPDRVHGEYPFIFYPDFHLVALNIMGRGDDHPISSRCDKWEHESATEFPADGEWYNTGNDENSAEWMEFDTAAGTLKYHYDNHNGISHEYEYTYTIEGDFLPNEAVLHLPVESGILKVEHR